MIDFGSPPKMAARLSRMPQERFSGGGRVLHRASALQAILGGLRGVDKFFGSAVFQSQDLVLLTQQPGDNRE